MPRAKGPTLPPYSKALTQGAADESTESYPAEYIKSTILELSSYLLDLATRSKLFGKDKPDPYSANLRTLFDHLHNGRFAPSSLPSELLREEHVRAAVYERTDKTALERPLADYEDLYYAVIARMQVILHYLNQRLKSGFNTASDLVYPLGNSITELHHSMSEYWTVLNHPSCGKAFDDAVRQGKVEAVHAEIILRVHSHNMSPEDADIQINELWQPKSYDAVKSMWFINEWSPAMINASLEGRYRAVLGLEKLEALAERRNSKLMKVASSQGSVKPVDGAQLPDHGSRKEVHVSDKGMRIDADHEQQLLQPKVYLPLDHFQHKKRIQQRIQHDMEQDRIYHSGIIQMREWQLKTQRVSEYKQYLMGRASREARSVVQSTVYNSGLFMNKMAQPFRDSNGGDTNMAYF